MINKKLLFSLKCSDAGYDCKKMITGNSKEEIMTCVMDHGKRDHNLTDNDFSLELMDKIQSLITESKE